TAPPDQHWEFRCDPAAVSSRSDVAMTSDWLRKPGMAVSTDFPNDQAGGQLVAVFLTKRVCGKLL
ncbi:MAG: hypothetical protein ACK5F7_06065, partial [Planctomycetaceae bacterium]